MPGMSRLLPLPSCFRLVLLAPSFDHSASYTAARPQQHTARRLRYSAVAARRHERATVRLVRPLSSFEQLEPVVQPHSASSVGRGSVADPSADMRARGEFELSVLHRSSSRS
jgi:hypothetical protein